MKTERINTLVVKAFAMVLTVALILSLFSVTAYASGLSVGSTAYVCADTKVHLREAPQGEIIGSLARGETVTILSSKDRNSYYHVRVNKTGLECYIYGEYLTAEKVTKTPSKKSSPAPTATPTPVPVFDDTPTYEEDYFIIDLSEVDIVSGMEVIVQSDGLLNMRKGPGKKFARIRFLKDGDILKVVSSTINNGYIYVMDVTDGIAGYVDVTYLAAFMEECWCQAE